MSLYDDKRNLVYILLSSPEDASQVLYYDRVIIFGELMVDDYTTWFWNRPGKVHVGTPMSACEYLHQEQ